MATGFTYPVGEKEGYLFEDFVWGCARAFGPLGHMRDDSSDAEIRPPAPSNYYHERLQEANKKYARLRSLSMEEATLERDLEYDESQKSVRASIEHLKTTRQKYQTMLDKVEAWNPPSPDHIKLKEFMVQQLKLELDYDADYYSQHLGEKKQTVQQWLQSNIQYAEEDMRRMSKRIDDEQENIKVSTQWINQLQQSVPFPKRSK